MCLVEHGAIMDIYNLLGQEILKVLVQSWRKEFDTKCGSSLVPRLKKVDTIPTDTSALFFSKKSDRRQHDQTTSTATIRAICGGGGDTSRSQNGSTSPTNLPNCISSKSATNTLVVSQPKPIVPTRRLVQTRTQTISPVNDSVTNVLHNNIFRKAPISKPAHDTVGCPKRMVTKKRKRERSSVYNDDDDDEEDDIRLIELRRRKEKKKAINKTIEQKAPARMSTTAVIPVVRRHLHRGVKRSLSSILTTMATSDQVNGKAKPPFWSTTVKCWVEIIQDSKLEYEPKDICWVAVKDKKEEILTPCIILSYFRVVAPPTHAAPGEETNAKDGPIGEHGYHVQWIRTKARVLQLKTLSREARERARKMDDNHYAWEDSIGEIWYTRKLLNNAILTLLCPSSYV